ncbi:MAG: ISNCY family transposase [Candidatus Auribacterota bacterium]|nr:ISNCY family transposase [Candidatus Auribacterota bacterium]
MRKDILTMSQKEVGRLHVIEKSIEKEISQRDAGNILRLSERQVRRLVRRVRQYGAEGVIHKLRGRQGNRKTDPGRRAKIIRIYRKEYQGFGPRLASEKLLECNEINVNEETLRLWLIDEGLWKKQKIRKKKKRSRRPRKECYGEMIQMDGSHHDWLEGRGPKMVLMGYIDDATGNVYGKFYNYEGTYPAMDSFKGYIKKNGIPRSIYLDKHSTYKVNKTQRYKEWPFRDQEELTQFARSCRQLGAELIYAHSPQAKGRVERLFETLQDRLVKELRLEKVKTLEEANKLLVKYLPKFNKRFKVSAKKLSNLHRLATGFDLNEIFSIQEERVLRNDRTLVHKKQWYQVLNQTRADKVVVYECLNGKIVIKNGKNRLSFKKIEDIVEKRNAVVRKVKPKRRYVPPKGSYWRSGFKLAGSLK